MKVKVYTLGTSNRSIKKFLEILKEYKIQIKLNLDFLIKTINIK